MLSVLDYIVYGIVYCVGMAATFSLLLKKNNVPSQNAGSISLLSLNLKFTIISLVALVWPLFYFISVVISVLLTIKKPRGTEEELYKELTETENEAFGKEFCDLFERMTKQNLFIHVCLYHHRPESSHPGETFGIIVITDKSKQKIQTMLTKCQNMITSVDSDDLAIPYMTSEEIKEAMEGNNE